MNTNAAESGKSIPHYIFSSDDISERARELRSRLVHLWSCAEYVQEASRPFLIATPVGLENARALASRLSLLGVDVVERIPVGDWARTSAGVYVKELDEATLRRAVLYEEAWSGAFGAADAEQWILRTHDDHQWLAVMKHDLRKGLASTAATAEAAGETAALHLHPFHVPDLGDLDHEFAVLSAARTAMLV